MSKPNKQVINEIIRSLIEYTANDPIAGNVDVQEDAVEDVTNEVVQKSIDVVFKEMDTAQQLVTGVVLVPNEVDAHGDIYNAEEVRKAAHDFVTKGFYNDSPTAGIQHRQATKSFTFVESFIAPVDMTIGEETVTKGTWLITAQILDKALWEEVQKGEFTGFSIGGTAAYRNLNDAE